MRTIERTSNAKIEGAGLRIIAQRRTKWKQADARKFYAVHAKRPFYKDLVKFMTSGPIVMQVLEGDNAIAKIRDMLGPTNSKVAPQGTIRGDLGVDMMVNVCHASDSPENGEIEVARFFDKSEIFAY